MDSDTEPSHEESQRTNLSEQMDISNVELPKYIALWRHNQPFQKNKFVACLLKTEKVVTSAVNKKVWKFELINNPLEYCNGILNSGILTFSKHNDSWFNSEKHKIYIQKNDVIVSTDILYNNSFILFDDASMDPIPVCKLKNKHGILPEEFFQLETSASSYGFMMLHGSQFTRINSNGQPTNTVSSYQQSNLRREAALFAERAAQEFLQQFEQNTTPIVPRRHTPPRRPRTPPRIARVAPALPTRSQPTPINSVSTIPQHIVNLYIEGIVAKKELCPITINELQKHTTCITPCGHAMTHSSMKHWLQGGNSCPVCRLPVSETQLQVWKI